MIASFLAVMGTGVAFIYGMAAMFALYCLGKLVFLRTRRATGREMSPRVTGAYIFLSSMLIAFVAEITWFNYPHYLRLWAGESTTFIVKEATEAERANRLKAELLNLNRDITALHIEVLFENADEHALRIVYKDEESTRVRDVKIFKFSPHSGYIPMVTHGPVSELYFMSEEDIRIQSITVNPVIPMKILSLRMVLLSLLLGLFGLALHRSTRPALSAFLFDTPLEEHGRKQGIVYWGMVFFVILFCLFTAYTTHLFHQENEERLDHKIYHSLTDAFLEGRLSLDKEATPELLNNSRPYDPAERMQRDTFYAWDAAYYDGKYYCYFGVVPVLLMFLPFKWMTGQHLPTFMGVFVFSALSCVLLALLWREIVQRFMRRMPFFLYLLGALTLVLCAGVALLCRRALTYEVVVAATMMFSTLGFLLLLKSCRDSSISYGKIFWGALALALAVGCRPTAVFLSLLVPVFLWRIIKVLPDGRTEKMKGLGKVALCVFIPYAAVALPLMWYNAARFGSVVDFGADYQLTMANIGALSLIDPMGKLLKVLTAFHAYFFNPLDFSAHFPFVSLNIDYMPPHEYGYDLGLPFYMHNTAVFGMVNFPVLWCLLNIRRGYCAIRGNNSVLRHLLMTLLGVGLLQILVLALYAGVSVRYALDFMWMFTLAALVCAYFTYEANFDNNAHRRFILKTIYLLCLASIAIEFFLSLTGQSHFIYRPLFHYLQTVFSIW
ncbi:MAG: hypothetical protein LBU11_04300 [Zoogloeaceae bacterium]|jgi:hypothetical protein|nr:hypothetical protein [Zoogloeaceae bacterium]